MKNLYFALAMICFGAPCVAQSVADGRALFVARDYGAAFAILEPAAASGDATAQNLMGVAYENCWGKACDIDLALSLYHAAAAQNFPKAHYNLGLFYRHGGQGIAPDLDLSWHHFLRAGELGEIDAASHLGRMAELGAGRAVNLDKAVYYYRIGAQSGSVFALGFLGEAYEHGRGVAQDLIVARALYRAAADLGYHRAQVNLGVMLDVGRGGPEDNAQARHYYELAFEIGDTKAGYNLALLYTKPETGFADATRAYAYCLWSMAHIEDELLEKIRATCGEFRAILTSDEINAAQILYHDF